MFNIFAATLHIWRQSPQTATWGHDMPWWQGPTSHTLRLTLKMHYLCWLYRYTQCIIMNWTWNTWQGDNKSGLPLVTFSKSMTFIPQIRYDTYTSWIAYAASYSVGTRSSSNGGRRLKAWGWHWLPCSAEVKNERSYTSILPVCVHGVHRHTFTSLVAAAFI
jgi:hypothetical protein